MFRFLLNTFLTALAVPFYLKWSRDQAEGQIDKMQQAVHGTPGAESPVTPAVLLGGAGLIGGALAALSPLWVAVLADISQPARGHRCRFWLLFLWRCRPAGAKVGGAAVGMAADPATRA